MRHPSLRAGLVVALICGVAATWEAGAAAEPGTGPRETIHRTIPSMPGARTSRRTSFTITRRDVHAVAGGDAAAAPIHRNIKNKRWPASRVNLPRIPGWIDGV